MLVALVVGVGIKFYHRDSEGEQCLAAAKQMVSEIPSYKDNTEYVDWLVTDAHDHCFNESYHIDYSRRGGHDTFDEDRYFTDLFSHMIDQAKFDKADQIVADLAALQKKLLGPQ